MKKSLKKINSFKLTHKKYSFADIFHTFIRQIIPFLIIVLVGINLGAILYLVAPKTNYKSDCQIQYSGHKLDEYQQSRIANMITCNESLDKYVVSLGAASVKYGDSYFSYSDLSDGLLASVGEKDDKATIVNFVISFSFRKQGYTEKVLYVISENIVNELNSIYTKDSFAVLTDSFTKEISYKISSYNYLLVPIAFSFIVAVAYVFIADGLNSTLWDYSECKRMFNKSIFLKKNKDLDFKKSFLFLSEFENLQIIADSSDCANIEKLLKDNNVFSDGINKKKEKKGSHSFVLGYDASFKFKNKTCYYYFVILGKTNYVSFFNNCESLKTKMEIADISVVCLDRKLFDNKK